MDHLRNLRFRTGKAGTLSLTRLRNMLEGRLPSMQIPKSLMGVPAAQGLMRQGSADVTHTTEIAGSPLHVCPTSPLRILHGVNSGIDGTGCERAQSLVWR